MALAEWTPYTTCACVITIEDGAIVAIVKDAPHAALSDADAIRAVLREQRARNLMARVLLAEANITEYVATLDAQRRVHIQALLTPAQRTAVQAIADVQFGPGVVMVDP
jgi:hypothetical protein